MPRNKITLKEKLAQAEDKIKEMIEQRKQELGDIFSHCNALAIDDKLLMGFLAFALGGENKDHAILKEFKELGKQYKLPSKRTKPKTKSDLKNTKTVN